jgi:hypothetical protein
MREVVSSLPSQMAEITAQLAELKAQNSSPPVATVQAQQQQAYYDPYGYAYGGFGSGQQDATTAASQQQQQVVADQVQQLHEA